MVDQKTEKIENMRCPHCNSSFNYFRIKEKKWQCRNCGKSFDDIKEQKEEKIDG